MNVQTHPVVYGERSDALRGATAQAVHCYCFSTVSGDRALVIESPWANRRGLPVKFCPYCGKGLDS